MCSLAIVKTLGFLQLKNQAQIGKHPDIAKTLSGFGGASIVELVQDHKGELKLNSNFAKFAMANLSGWSDKQQLSGDAANPLAFLMQKIDGSTKDLVHDEH